MIRATSKSSSLKNIWRAIKNYFTVLTTIIFSESITMPIRETVAGLANRRSCVSNKKLTLGPKEIRSPLGRVSK